MSKTWHRIKVIENGIMHGFDFDPAKPNAIARLLADVARAGDNPFGRMSEEGACEVMRQAGELLFDYKWDLAHPEQ